MIFSLKVNDVNNAIVFSPAPFTLPHLHNQVYYISKTVPHVYKVHMVLCVGIEGNGIQFIIVLLTLLMNFLKLSVNRYSNQLMQSICD